MRTPYDSPAPDVPIPGSLTVNSYAVSLERTGPTRLKTHNLLAEISGHVEFLTGKTRVQTLGSIGAMGMLQRPYESSRELLSGV